MRTKKLLGTAAALLTLAVFAACSSSSKNNTSSSTSSSSGSSSSSSTPAGLDIDYATLAGELKGGGSSLQDTFDQAVKVEFAKVATGLTVNYAKSSSGDGIAALAGKTLDFAGSDRAAKASELAAGDILYFPTVAAPITVSYNLPGVTDLKLDASTVAKLFSAQITTWNDPAIAALNSGATLPSTPVVICHRGDNSGTTNNFTTYLKAAAPSDWTLDVGGTVSNWPANSTANQGSGAEASCVSGGAGAIGYVDVADAIKANLTYASVKNANGKFVKADLAGTEAALTGALSTVQADLTYNPINATGDAAYPITSPTFIIVYKNQATKQQGEALKGWLNFILTKGQDLAASAGYAALPSALQQMAVQQLSSLVIPAS